jgi:hypothetical protein
MYIFFVDSLYIPVYRLLRWYISAFFAAYLWTRLYSERVPVPVAEEIRFAINEIDA